MTTKTSYANGQFSWVDYMSKDMAKATAFYQSLFGWDATPADTQSEYPYTLFSYKGQQTAGLGEMDAEMKAKGFPPVWNSYISVNNIDEVTKQAEQLGGKILFPPTPAADAGKMAFIQDPTGATFALWQKINHHGADLVNSPNSFCWNELISTDLDKALDFFYFLLGWKYDTMNMGVQGKSETCKVNDDMNVV